MGSLSSDEQAEFDKLMQDDSFRKEVEIYASIYQISTRLQATPSFDASNAWNEVDAKISTKPSVMWSRRAWVGAAASVALILISWFIFRSPQSDPNTGLSLLAQDNAQVHELNDGSVVYVQEGSELMIGDGFNETDRKLELSGTACFQVAPLKDFPFTVVSGEAVVTVTGTRFTLSPDQLYVSEGHVNLSNLGIEVDIVAGQSVDLLSNKTSLIEPDQVAAWIQGAMEFNNVSLKVIIDQAQQFYKTNIRISESRLDERFTVSLEGLSLDEAVNILAKLTNTRISKDSQGYILE